MSHTFSRPVELLQPGLGKSPSGGNIYNAHLVEAAKERGVALSLRFVDPSDIGASLREHSTSLRICDSLFIEALATAALADAGDWGLMLHYLPSRNPSLENEERTRLEALEVRVTNAASLVIVTGRALLEPVHHYAVRRPVCVCEPGVAPVFAINRGKRSGGSERAIHLLTVANMLPAKGLVDLVGILALLQDLPWEWHVVGEETLDASYTRRFSDMATHFGLDARIRRYGQLDQSAIALMMESMDLFVFPTLFEAYGMALAEAAAAGLPAVTTDVGAASRIYHHGSTGFVVPPGEMDRFAACLCDLMTDGELRERFRENLCACTPRAWQDTLDDFLAAISTIQ
jgi:glycosyltransferase involved in cell wall biosynthesis